VCRYHFFLSSVDPVASIHHTPTATSIIPEIGHDPVAAVRAGLPYAALDRVRQYLDVSDDRLAPILGVSSRTLRRRRGTGTLTTDESDRLVLLAEIIARAQRVLDHSETAREWLCTPHSLLGGESPLDPMDTVTGMQEVETMLHPIEHGMPV
jgi:putative toxin-antitoxin system antitoxin component (TIGR02293 family)